MSSAQVSRKQEHLEAGKRKLEEFRRKKAAEKAKKITTNQALASDGDQNVRKPSETEHVLRSDSNDIGTFVLAKYQEGGTTIPNVTNKEFDISLKSDSSSPANSNAKPPISTNHIDTNSSVRGLSHLKSEEFKGDDASVALDRFRSTKDDNGSSTQLSSGVGNYHFLDHNLSSGKNHPSSHPSFLELDAYPSNNNYGPEKDLSYGEAGESTPFTGSILPQNSVSNLQPFKMGNSGQGDNRLTFSTNPDVGDKRFSGAINHFWNMNHLSPWTSNNRYVDYDSDSDARSSSNHAPPSPKAGRRSRSSFLDSINIPKGPSSSPSLFEAAKNDSSSKVYPMDGLGSSASHRSADSLVASGEGVYLFSHAMDSKNNLFSQKQNDDFAALEQHIEDLTQEKFSLQRALEASQALAESLASENSALTDSFNQQGAVVNQLKFDLEQLQEEINARLVELEAMKHEYVNAQMECNAADERAKLLASEVIGLEEKALHLRSNELKLEREMEKAESEISSYRKKISSLERDREDLQSTINALHEEKKLLQSKLRKTPSSGKSIYSNKAPCAKQDVSTSTDDLDINATIDSANSENIGNSLFGEGAPCSQFADESIEFGFDGQPMAIPSDQIRMIQNINTLLAELVLEKDQLVQALSAESSQSSRLLELNKELTRKLEAQTQRLELLTAKSMVSDSIQPRQQDYRIMHETVAYADEGDEVVERVLGWIMKLFPGRSSSRQRSSKHL